MFSKKILDTARNCSLKTDAVCFSETLPPPTNVNGAITHNNHHMNYKAIQISRFYFTAGDINGHTVFAATNYGHLSVILMWPPASRGILVRYRYIFTTAAKMTVFICHRHYFCFFILVPCLFIIFPLPTV
jgi:hypothetical protein